MYQDEEQFKPSKMKVFFAPLGMISLIVISLYFIGVFALLMGVSKVGAEGVLQAFKNNSDVVYGFILPTLGFLILQLLYRVLLLKKRLRISGQKLTLVTVFRQTEIDRTEIAKITKSVNYLFFSTELKIKCKNNKVKKLDVSTFKGRDIETVLKFLLESGEYK